MFFAGTSRNKSKAVVVTSADKELKASVVSIPNGYVKVETTLTGDPTTVEVTL